MRRWLSWASAAAVAAPLAIVLHELGHYLAGLAFGFPDLVLHYGNVADGAEKAGFPIWQRGIQAAAGPLATLLIVVGSGIAALRFGPTPWAVAPAFAAGVRSVAIGIGYLVARVRLPEAQVRGDFDEMNAATRLGLAPEPVIAVNVIILLAIWTFLFSRVQRGQRLVMFTAVAIGTAAGIAVYGYWLGPLLLP